MTRCISSGPMAVRKVEKWDLLYWVIGTKCHAWGNKTVIGRARSPGLMASVLLPQLRTGWHVDQAIVTENERLVVIRFGRQDDRQCMIMDELLSSIAGRVRNFAAIYLCDIDKVPDFNEMYDLTDPMTVMFFYQNKHMMCDFGTGNNNKLNFTVDDKQEMIDILETIFRGARKNKGLVVSPFDYNHKRVS